MLIEYGNTVVVPNWELHEPKPTGFSRIYYVKSGDVTFEAEGVQIKLRPGYLYALPSTVPYNVWRNRRYDFACTYLHIDFFQAHVTGLIELDVKENTCLWHYMQAMIHAIDEKRPDLLEDMANSMGTFFRHSRHFRFATDMLNIVQSYIMNNIASPISIDELARLFSYHPNYFIRLFRQESGFTPHQFILRLRMQYAVVQLRKGLSNQEVCYSCGFTDSSTFTRAFRNFYGVTPQKYMQGYRRL